ncbi:LacI family DNA-binding transcriptional regulator [Bifidobacterium sp. 64T4]|uniref:LacI family DNA-binding transcriptional regulator n=1 Tax=Bifidobacterium pongonis TaxID=2834432 RepID=UPI001C5995C7|nr:LacI family DNA-binding transcriptional regulator [Bifidobacterium pongonis]MBW3094842.1 LacI family DNA-binding transcriptional regulator [Bifidobacterium pongonis]
MAGIKDVAAKAHVSISTVSYVMSGKRSIGDDTKRAVLDAAKELGYLPRKATPDVMAFLTGRPITGDGDDWNNRFPSSGTHKRTKVLALSSPVHGYTDYSNYAMFFFGLASRAKRYGYDILLLMHEYGDQELVRVTRSGMVDGILLLDVLMHDSRAEVAPMLDVPVVSVGYPSNSESVYSVDLDFERMGREAVEKAATLGHTRVLIIGTNEFAYEDGSNYLIRFRDAAIKHGSDLGVKVTFMASTGYGMADVRLLLDSAFANDSEITAIICQTNPTHVNNLLIALQERGLRVPQDISLMAACTQGVHQLSQGVDEMPMDPHAVCMRAIDIMMEALEGRRHDVGAVELLPPKYLARGTMGPRRAG